MSATNIILFDGDCGLCQRSVQFILPRDPQGRFHFAPLQSERGQALLAEQGWTESQRQALDSVVLIEAGRVYTRSTAALRIAKGLGGLWPILFYLGILWPPFVRNAVYGLIARHRKRWFSTQDESCWLMRPDWRQRFLS